MGYDGDICFDAAQKYPNNINNAIDCIETSFKSSSSSQKSSITNNPSQVHLITAYEETKTNTSSFPNDDTISNEICYRESVADCPALRRIINTMKFYYNSYDDNDTLLKYSQNCATLLQDFHHILDEHLSEHKYGMDKSNEQFSIIYNQMVIENGLACDIMKCKIYLRNNRERESKSNDCDDKHLSIFIETLDCIHCYFIHSVDIGYRILNRNFNNFTQLQSYLSSKRSKLVNIRGKTRMSKSKFVSDANNMMESDAAVENKTQSITVNQKQNKPKYSFGHRILDLSIKPKYYSMKDELLNNALYSICVDVFDAAYGKADYLLKHSVKIKRLQMLNFAYNDKLTAKYYLKAGSRLTITHILSVILYTDYDTLSSNFSKTFRKIDDNESFDDILKRNQEYRHWSHALCETVNGFGRSIRIIGPNVLYHGTSNLYVEEQSTLFNAPTSTTTQLSVATMFAGDDGLILELTSTGSRRHWSALRCFDCSFISNFANEAEILFIHPPYHEQGICLLRISRIRYLSNELQEQHEDQDNE